MIQLNADAGLEYKEKNPVKPTKNAELVISVLFSPFTYDFLKEQSLWHIVNEKNDKFYYNRRFLTTLKYTVKIGKIKPAPNEVTLENVSVNKLYGKAINGGVEANKAQIAKFHKVIFIDCTKKDKDGNLLLTWEIVTGYLSYAISEVKDYLFRQHKYGYHGKVKFVVSAYHPLEPLPEAFCNAAGVPIQIDLQGFSGFTSSVLQKTWFKNFKQWLKKHEWTPEEPECAIFDGQYYGGAERKSSSIALDRIRKIQNVINNMDPYVTHYTDVMTGKPMVKVNPKDKDMIQWKKCGGATTKGDYNGEGYMPVYHWHEEKYGWEYDGRGIEKEAMFFDTGNEQPLAFLTYSLYDIKISQGARLTLLRSKKNGLQQIDVNGDIPEDKLKALFEDYKLHHKDQVDTTHPTINTRVVIGIGPNNTEHPLFRPINPGIGRFFTYNQLKKEQAELQMVVDEDPMFTGWSIKEDSFKRNAWAVGAYSTTNEIDGGKMAEMMAKVRTEQLKEWEEKVYNPQMNECNDYMGRIEKRQNDATEHEIWERKSVEDEDVSDEWSAEIDKIDYKGKQKDYNYFYNKREKLKEEKANREAEIKDLEDYASLVSALKVLSTIQFALGIISFGATTTFAAATFLVIDSLLEVAKMGFEIHYKKDYTISDALQDHMFSFINNLVSGLLLHSSIAKFTEAEVSKINSLSPAVSSPTNYVAKQISDFRVWKDNLAYAAKGREAKHFFHLAAGGAKAASFAYVSNSLYETSLFITNKQELSTHDMKKLGLLPKDK